MPNPVTQHSTILSQDRMWLHVTVVIKAIALKIPPTTLKHKGPASRLSHDLVTNQTVTPWLTSREAASYLKVEHRTLLAWARQGKVRGYALSAVQRRIWRFRTVDLDATMEVPAVLTVEAE